MTLYTLTCNLTGETQEVVVCDTHALEMPVVDGDSVTADVAMPSYQTLAQLELVHDRTALLLANLAASQQIVDLYRTRTVVELQRRRLAAAIIELDTYQVVTDYLQQV